MTLSTGTLLRDLADVDLLDDMVFLRLDGKSYVDLLWPRVRPEVAPSTRSSADDGD